MTNSLTGNEEPHKSIQLIEFEYVSCPVNANRLQLIDSALKKDSCTPYTRLIKTTLMAIIMKES